LYSITKKFKTQKINPYSLLNCFVHRRKEELPILITIQENKAKTLCCSLVLLLKSLQPNLLCFYFCQSVSPCPCLQQSQLVLVHTTTPTLKKKAVAKLVSATLPLLPRLPSSWPPKSIDSLCRGVSSTTRLSGKNLHLIPSLVNVFIQH
jgi:hypothetical protein